MQPVERALGLRTLLRCRLHATVEDPQVDGVLLADPAPEPVQPDVADLALPAVAALGVADLERRGHSRLSPSELARRWRPVVLREPDPDHYAVRRQDLERRGGGENAGGGSGRGGRWPCRGGDGRPGPPPPP